MFFRIHIYPAQSDPNFQIILRNRDTRSLTKPFLSFPLVSTKYILCICVCIKSCLLSKQTSEIIFLSGENFISHSFI